MIEGRTIQQLVQQISANHEAARDYIVNPPALEMLAPGQGERNVMMVVQKHGAFHLRPVAHQQLAEFTGIPKKYYDRMLTEAPDLLSRNVNRWLETEKRPRMVRCLMALDAVSYPGDIRAILSNSYRRLDNLDLMEAILPPMRDSGVEIKSCEITERRMYLQVICPWLSAEDPGSGPRKGDIIKAGVVISNSEVGLGSLRVEPLVYRCVCDNGAIMGVSLMKYHIGRRQGGGSGEDIWELLSTETKQADDKAFFLTVRDIVKRALDRDIWDQNVRKLQAAADNKIDYLADGTVPDLPKVVEITAKDRGLTDSEGNAILQHLINGGDLSQYGLGNAVTRVANDLQDYDRAIELERVGGEVFEMPRNQWQQLMAKAA